MIRDPEQVRALKETAKAQWLSRLTLAEAFRIAEDMDRFSRAMAPEAFRLPADGAGLQDDPHIRMQQRVHAAFGKVRPPGR